MCSEGKLICSGVNVGFQLLQKVRKPGKVVCKGLQLTCKVGKVTGRRVEVSWKLDQVTYHPGKVLEESTKYFSEELTHFSGTTFLLAGFEKYCEAAEESVEEALKYFTASATPSSTLANHFSSFA